MIAHTSVVLISLTLSVKSVRSLLRPSQPASCWLKGKGPMSKRG